MVRKGLCIVAGLLLALLPVAASGAQGVSLDFSDVTVVADDDGLRILFADGSDVDDFVHAEHLFPGTVIHRTMDITNSIDLPYQLTLTAKNPYSSPTDFIGIVQLRLTFDGRLVYDGPLGNELNDLGQYKDNDIDLGSIAPGDTHALAAEFILPGDELDNDYLNAYAKVDWVLVATKPEATPTSTPHPTEPPPGEPGGEGPTPAPSGGVGVPPPATEPPTPTQAGGGPPQTGYPNYTAWLLAALALSLCLVILGIWRPWRRGKKGGDRGGGS